MKLTPEKIYELFVHRKDVFIEHRPDGSCFPKRRRMQVSDIINHISGEATYSIYCINTDNTVKWAAIDLDKKIVCPNCSSEKTYVLKEFVYCQKCGSKNFSKEAKTLYLKAQLIYNTFTEFKRILEWSGRKGYHIWIFFDSPIYAQLARIIIYSRLNKLNIWGVEVFPKQGTLSPTIKYGSSLKLPLGIHRVTGQRTKILMSENI